MLFIRLSQPRFTPFPASGRYWVSGNSDHVRYRYPVTTSISEAPRVFYNLPTLKDIAIVAIRAAGKPPTKTAKDPAEYTITWPEIKPLPDR